VCGKDAPTRRRDLRCTLCQVDQSTGEGLKFVFLRGIDLGQKSLEIASVYCMAKKLIVLLCGGSYQHS
jgi:hypothetical protein